MNIGLLIYDLRSGGAERVLCKWSDLLSEGHSVTLYTFDGASESEYCYSGKLTVLDVPSKRKGKIGQIQTLIKRYWRLRRQIKRDGIDLLISFCSTANFPAMLQRCPRLASIRLYAEYFSYRRIYRFLIKHTKTALAVQTNRLKADILADVGERYAPKIHVIANPLDVDAIRAKLKEEPEKAILDRIRGKQVICFTASFKTSKNHWNLIKSFRLLHCEMPDTVLLLIGADGELEQRIRQMVAESDIADAVIFVGKALNPFRYEKKADLFVLPSLTEGIPNVLIEALAVGLPVISTDCPSGPREILFEEPDLRVITKGIEQADYGILVEQFPREPNFDFDYITEQNRLLAHAMQLVLSDPALRESYRGKALCGAKKYDMDTYKEQLYALVGKCIKQ
ncbi:MAG: glycosyltransferase [Clostridia bacterium]|nr:glycosyltransferase [Clostridia bacterium]